MTVRSLILDHFRNYGHLEAEFDPQVNVIQGENAQGKTNLLEALFYLSTARSHRARYDRELLQFGAQRAALRASLEAREREFVLEAELKRGSAKRLWSNGVKLKSAGELSGILTTVLFCPEDLSLVKAGAAERRRFLDDCLCQLRPRYAAALAEYRRLYEHKTRILRDAEQYPGLLDTLDDFSVGMVRAGAVLIHYRARLIEKLAGLAPVIHREFSGAREELELRYQTVSTVTDPMAEKEVLQDQLMDHWQRHRRAELESRQCLSGPHKDDIEILLEGVLARTYASQGQTRTAALSLKLSSRELMWEQTGEWPVLLLDDVLSELDEKRQEFVLNRIKGGQVFLTCCGPEQAGLLRAGRVFHVKQGKLM